MKKDSLERYEKMTILSKILSISPAVISTPIAKIVPGKAYPIAEILVNCCKFLLPFAAVVHARNVAIVTIIRAPNDATIIVFCRIGINVIKSVKLKNLLIFEIRIKTGMKNPHVTGIRHIVINMMAFKL